MSLYDMLNIVCSMTGFYGFFNIAHHTRIRRAAPFFYALSMCFACNILAVLKGSASTLAVMHEVIVCGSAIVAINYAISIKRYWSEDS